MSIGVQTIFYKCNSNGEFTHFIIDEAKVMSTLGTVSGEFLEHKATIPIIDFTEGYLYKSSSKEFIKVGKLSKKSLNSYVEKEMITYLDNEICNISSN